MTTRNRPKVPPGMYAPDASGLLDPSRPSIEDRLTKSAARSRVEGGSWYANPPRDRY